MIDAALVLAFVAWSVGAGFRDRREASRDLTAYFLAGRRLPGWQSGLSMAATQYSADTPMLAAGLVATGGIAALWRLWSYGIAFLLLGFLLAPAWWRAGVLTDAELCELRYSGRAASLLRAVKAIYFGFVFNCAALAMVLTAAVRIAEAFLDWQAWLPTPVFAALESLVREVGVPLSANPDPEGLFARTASNLISVVAILGFTLLYSATGGLRSVIRTDVMQLTLVGLSTAAYAGFAIAAVGGLEQLPIRLAELEGAAAAATRLSFDPRQAAEAGGTLLAIVGLQWLLQMNSDGTGYLAQRCMACHSADEARRAPVYFAFVQILGRSLLWLPILVALLVLFPLAEGQTPAERELAFVSGVDMLLPIGVRGLMLVGLLAALASTLDTHLNWGASYLTNDLFARFLLPRSLAGPARSRALVWCARACSPLLMVTSLALMTRLGSIQEAWHVTLTLGAGLGIPLLLRWLWRRANAWGELAAIGASGLAAWLGLRSGAEESTRLLFVGAVGAVAAVAGSLATRPEDDERLDAFLERVRPPGFWGVPHARRALATGLARTAAAAISLYGLLVGLGILLVGAPAPIPIPRPLFVAACLAAAAGAAPFWLRGLRRRPPPSVEPPRSSH